MKQGVLGEGPGRGWGTRENDESGNDIGGLRRRPRGHAPPYSLLFLVLDLGPPQPLPPHPPVMPPPRRFTMVVLASPWFLRAPPLFPALSPTFPLSSFLPSVCWLVSLHTRLLGRAGRGWGGGKFRGGVRSAVSRPAAAGGRGGERGPPGSAGAVEGGRVGDT